MDNEPKPQPYETGETRSFQAANGHLMEYYVDSEGKIARAASWASWHSDECPCETGGADIPDW